MLELAKDASIGIVRVSIKYKMQLFAEIVFNLSSGDHFRSFELLYMLLIFPKSCVHGLTYHLIPACRLNYIRS